MLSKKNICVVVGFIFVTSLFAQELDYMPKSLLKALKKEGITDLAIIREINVFKEEQDRHHFNGKYFRVMDDAVQACAYIYIGRVYSCRSGGCSFASDTSPGVSSEYFDYFMLFDSEKAVREVKVYNYQATHGYEITAKGWLKQFHGHKGGELHVGKNIDAISGATISAYAITQDVVAKTNLLSASK